MDVNKTSSGSSLNDIIQMFEKEEFTSQVSGYKINFFLE